MIYTMLGWVIWGLIVAIVAFLAFQAGLSLGRGKLCRFCQKDHEKQNHEALLEEK